MDRHTSMPMGSALSIDQDTPHPDLTVYACMPI